MNHKSIFIVWRAISVVLLFTMLALQIPQPVYAATVSVLGTNSHKLSKKATNPLGTLAFPAELDADNDPATNPSALSAVPVWRVRTLGPTQGVMYGQLLLGVQVLPADARTNPIHTPVTFHLWNPSLGLDVIRVAESDVWGAATLEVPLDDLHLSGEFFYQASAPGYGETPVRSFRMNTTRSAGETLLGAASLKLQVAPDGLLTAQVESQIPWAAASPLPVSIRVTRLSPVADSQDVAMEIYPFLMAQPLDDRRARAEIYLDPGTYALMAQVDLDGGTRQAVSDMQTIVIESSAPPSVAYVEAIDESSIFGDSALVQYRAPDGSLALVRRSITDLPQTRPQPSQQGLFTQTRRISAFRWDTRTYEMKVQTISDDGKKFAALTDFHYDPIARTYHIQVNSLMDAPVEDTMTLQALGPNGVVIYEETVPVLLDPAAPLEYDFQVPTKFGEVYGLRVIVHDPLSLEFLFTPVTNAAMAVANSLNPSGLTLAFNFGFEISLKLLNINLFVFGTNCLNGNCTTDKKGLMVENSSTWATTVQNGIIDYLRDNFQKFAFAPDPLDTILEEIANGFTLELGAGAFVLRFGINGIEQLYNLSCQDAKARAAAKAYTDSVGAQLDALTQMITFRFKQQSERFQRDAPKVPFPGPLAAFLALKFTSVIAFKLEGGTQGDFGLRLTFFLEVGPKLAIVLTLPSFAITQVLRLGTYITKFVTLVQTVLMVKNVVQIIRDGVTNAPARSACPKPPPGNGGDDGGGDDPPPPNGSPDDRRDPVFENYLRTPQGSSGRIQELEQFLQLAQQRSFARAETYFTLLLARERYSQAQAAVTEDLDRALQLQALTDATTERMQGIISGTIPITAGLTITDALAIEYENFTAELENTPGARELQQLADDAAFAERRYQELAGQELELQHEIANLFDRTAGLGVLDSGLTRWTVAAMGSVGVFAQPVRLFAGMRSNVPNSRVYTPFTAPPVLIVPTGGLYRLRNSQLARTWLDDYVANGGTLLVLAQARDEDWQMLPGGEVRGVGYFNDILCRQASVRVANTSEWLYGIGRDLPDLQIDGSFTAYPQNTRVLLVRTTGNQMPAMIEYTYGSGRVLATSAYPDFYINGMQSSEDAIFARSFFGQAYLLANHQQAAAEAAAPNTTVTVPLTVTTGAGGLTTLTLWRDYFSDQAAESWRWSAHREDWARQGIGVNLLPSVPPSTTQSVPVTFTAPQVAGLFRVGFIHGAIEPCTRYNWGSGFTEYCPPPPSYVLPGSFYRVASLTFPNPPENALVANALSYAYGETAILTATLSNPSPTARTITLQPVGGLDDTTPITVTLPPGGSVQQVYAQFVRQTISVRIDILENEQPVGQMVAPLFLRAPQVGLTFLPNSALAGMTTTLVLTATLSGEMGALNEIEWRITGNNGFNQSAFTPLASAGTYSQTTFSLNLPPAFPKDTYFAAVALPGASQDLLKQQIRIKRQGSLDRAEWLALPTIGAVNTDTLRLTFNPVSVPASAVVETRLVSGFIPGDFQPRQSIPLSNAPTILDLDVPLLNILDLGIGHRIEISTTITLSTTGFTFHKSAFLPLRLTAPAPLEFNSTILMPGQAFSITVPLQIGDARLPQNSTFSLTALNRLTLTSKPLPIAQTELLPDGRVRLHSAMPANISSAPYDLLISNNALADWRGQVSTFVPGMFLTHNVPTQVSAGQTLTWHIVNDGLRDEILTGTLTLQDAGGNLLAQTDFQGVSLPENQSTVINLFVPSQAAAGEYTVQLSVQDQLGLRENQNRVIALNGQAALLQSQSDQSVYLSNQTVSILSSITPTLPMNDALLRLQIYSLRSDVTGTITATGWLARYADSGNTSAVLFDVEHSFDHVSPFTNTLLPPLTVGDLTLYVTSQFVPETVGTQSTNYTLHAIAHSGFPLWQQTLPNQPIALATNGSFVYVLDFGQITAYNLINPAIQWQYSDPDAQAMYGILVNEHAVIARHNFPPVRAGINATTPGYTLLNPATGVPFGEVEANGNALLNGTRLYSVAVDSGTATLSAIDILSNTIVWSNSVPTDLYLLAANQQHLVAFSESSNTLWHFSPTGGFLNTIVIGSFALTPGSYTLQGDNFFFLQQLPDSGGNTTKIHRLNLLNNTLSELTQTSGTLQGLIAVGQRLYAINQDDQVLISFNAVDGTLNGMSFPAECLTSNEIVPWSPNPLNNDPGGVYLYDPSNQMICPRPVTQGRRAAQPTALPRLTLLREEFVPVNGSSQIDLNTPLTAPNLLDDPRARGLLFLRATLFGAEPAAAAATERQILAEDSSSFFVEETSGAAVLLTDAQIYRRNQPGYTPDDDASIVHLSGFVRNTSSLASDITLSLTRDGQTLLTQTFTNVAAGDERQFDFEDAAPPVGIHLYEAFNSLGGSAGAEVEIVAPQITATLSAAPSLLYLGDAAQAQTVLTNNGSTPAFVTADANGSSQNVRILAGQTLTLTQIVTPSQSGAFNLTLTLTGDVTQTQTFPLTVIDETAISGSIHMFGAVRDEDTLLQDQAAGLEIILSHSQPLTLSVQALVQIQGPDFFSQTVSLPLPQGTTAFTVTPGILPLGAYSVNVQISSGRNGALLTEFSRTFEIAEPQTQLTLTLQTGTPDLDGTQPVTITVANLLAADLAWEGQLNLEGLLSEGITVTLNPGDALTFARSVNLLDFAGAQSITATLHNIQDGVLLTQTLTINGAPRNAPAVTLLEAAQEGEAFAAGVLNLRVRLDNPGPAGEVFLSVDAFDTTLNPQVGAPSGESEIFFQIPIPAGLLAGRYPVTVRLNEQVIRFDAVLGGNQLEVSTTFDAETYAPFSPFVWTVNLLASGGSPAQYDVFIRYRGEEQTQTITLNPGQSTSLSAAFLTPQVSNDLITVIVTNHPLAGQARYNLLIYADRVPIQPDDGVWLETDKTIYDAGETVNLTIHFDRPTLFAAVMAPEDIPDGGAPLLWSSLQVSPTVPITVSAVVTGSDGLTRTATITLTQHIWGEFEFTYNLPETMRSGRYAFKLFFDSQERLVPIDVNGVTMVVETLDVLPVGVAQRTPLGAAQAFTLQAQVRSSVTVNNARLLAYAVDGAGRYYELGAGASITQTLQAGLNNIQLSGALQAAAPGAYSIVFKVYNQGLQAELAGELSVLEVGSAMLHNLTTSRGVYAPGEPGLGTLTVFGTGSAQLRVTTSDGTPLLAQSDSLNGFREYTFTLPTAVALDEVLIATLTDTLGLTSSLQTAYKVAAEFDITAPEIALLTPTDGALLTVSATPVHVTISGLVTDTGGVAQVYLTQGFSQTQATVQPDGVWQAEVDFALGYNTFQVVAFDTAGNPAVEVFGVFVEPDYGVTLSVTPTTAPAGSLLTFSSVITGSVETTITVQFPFANAGIQAISGLATGGELTLGSAPTWIGRVSPNAPVTITWIGQANQVIETQVQAHAQTEGNSLRVSPPVSLQIVTAEPSLNELYLPIIFHNFNPYGYP